ncbi:MAG TPA: universal stress protein [Roseiarcus sp.]|nr:universal stress protein [Roseiarcus sp.]
MVGQGAPGEARLDRQVVSAALFGSGRPVFVVPFTHKGAAKFEKAMVCWDGGAQAAKALAASMPLLARSKSTEIITFSGATTGDKEPSPDIIRHLARHGIGAKMTELPGAHDIGEAILSYAADISADYIVMGAYGHWRLAEFVIGGTTRTILESMTAPIFMAH